PEVFFPRFGGSVKKAEESLEGLIRNAYSGVVGKHSFSHFVSVNTNELQFAQIEQEMLKRIQDDARASGYGLDVRFLGIKRLGLPESVTKVVFTRMESERKRQVSEIENEGQRQVTDIRSAAERKASEILAEADAHA